MSRHHNCRGPKLGDLQNINPCLESATPARWPIAARIYSGRIGHCPNRPLFESAGLTPDRPNRPRSHRARSNLPRSHLARSDSAAQIGHCSNRPLPGSAAVGIPTRSRSLPSYLTRGPSSHHSQSSTTANPATTANPLQRPTTVNPATTANPATKQNVSVVLLVLFESHIKN